MLTEEFDEVSGTLKFALTSAVYLIADMDDSLDWGCADVVAEEIIENLQKTAPLLMSEVTHAGLRANLLSFIKNYDILRQLVPNWLDLESYLESRRKVSLDDLLYVLDAEGWDTSYPSFYSLFQSILPVIRPRLEDRYTIPW